MRDIFEFNMPAKLSLAAFDRTTSVGILALQHLINKLEGLPQLRAVDQHEAGILASRLSKEYQDPVSYTHLDVYKRQLEQTEIC